MAAYRIGGVAEFDRQRLAQERGSTTGEIGDFHTSNGTGRLTP
jgi:hypothetical protein